MTPYAGAYAPFPMPHQAGGHTVAYGLMTPPDSPDKPVGRGQDFHAILDARGPQLHVFDVRQGMPLKTEILQMAAVNHPVRVMRVSMGPLSFDIANTGGSTLTVYDVVYGLTRALNTIEASPQEVAAAVQMGFAHPNLPQRGVPRARLIDMKPYFGGFTLRSIQHGVAIVDCHLRSHS
ncbi:hypothetical protein LXA43DRAFT_895352 [Ganoderma leucocontextum]|nr:hypothetical protein LXA43DRAFT_895352 [Ganoderma leucocontextum]